MVGEGRGGRGGELGREGEQNYLHLGIFFYLYPPF